MAQVDQPLQNVPGGRLSYISHPEGTIHIQTEFSSYPALRVITTVVSNGAVLYKKSSDWEKPVGNEQEYSEAEVFLISQHKRIYKKIVEEYKFSGAVKEIDSGSGKNSSGIITDIIEKIKRLDDAGALAIFDSDGVVLHSSDEKCRQIAVNTAPAISAFTELISGQFNSGEFRKAVFKSADNGLCWLNTGEVRIGLQSSKPESTLSELIKVINGNG